MKLLKGFTLAEVLVTLSVIAILGVITLPQLAKVKPNQEVLMLKKSYYLIGRTINELINDDDFYPETDGENYTSGFSDTSEAFYHGRRYVGNSKFCNLVAARMNVRGTVDCDNEQTFTDGAVPGSGNFSTTDGMVWILPVGNFDSGTAPTGDGTNIAQSIWVDVNGDKGGNCTLQSANDDCSQPDRFEIKLDRWGRIFVTDPVTRLYLETTDNTKTHAELFKRIEWGSTPTDDSTDGSTDGSKGGGKRGGS